MKTFKITSTPKNFYVNYLKAINGPVGLSKKEIVILAEFFRQGEKYRFEGEVLFSTIIKKKVANSLGITSHNLNNVILKFKEKSVIIKRLDTFIINPNLLPILEDNKIRVNFEIERKDDNKD